MEIPELLAAKFQRLQEIFAASYQKVIVAYSGGVDSAFLLKVAVDCLGPNQVLACIGVSESLPLSEYQAAYEIARQIGARVEVIHPQEMDNPAYRCNLPDRCYHCKTELYGMLRELAGERGYDAVLCGTNADDLADFRPGMEAVRKYHIESPLEEAGMTKEDIRILSKALGLETWDKPAQPCLASRLPYGQEITPEKLQQIEQGEEFLHTLGLRELRVRHHGDLVRIEVPTAWISKLASVKLRGQIIAYFKELGFTYISLDLEGFRSGSANEVL